MSLYSEIKKYLLVLVGFFCLVVIAHLTILYLYHDARRVPLTGGTINIGTISADTPSMDVLNIDTKIENDKNDMIMHFLFRSVVRYSQVDKKIVGDLADCNLSTFPNIRCTLSQDAMWDDGSVITVDDVISTYAMLREKSHNENVKARLALVNVTMDKGDAIFRFKSDDTTLLDVLFLPIVRKKDIAQLSESAGMFGVSVSGPFKIAEISPLRDVILLKKNTTYNHTSLPYFVDQVRFGFGTTHKELKKNITPDILLSETTDTISGDFVNMGYLRPIFYGAFFNSARVPTPLRSALIHHVFAKNQETSDTYITPENIFLGAISSTPLTDDTPSFLQTAVSLGYSFGGTAKIVEKKERFTPTKFIKNPSSQSPFFATGEMVEIAGGVPEGTNRVIIGDYELKNFKPETKTFSYRAKTDFGNLIEGLNTIKVQFFDGTKPLGEDILNVYYSLDTTKLTDMRTQWGAEMAAKEVPTTPIVSTTDPKKLYSPDGKVMHFSLLVQSGIPFLETIAENIKKTTTELGAEVEIIFAPLREIREKSLSENTPYDIVLAGINLGTFHYNLMPFFHSGHIKSGTNLTHVKSATLDSQLEKLIDSLFFDKPDVLRKIQVEIQKNIISESLVYDIGVKKETLYALEHIQGLKIPSFLIGQELLHEIVSPLYFKQKYEKSSEEKTIPGFFLWLKNVLFNPS